MKNNNVGVFKGNKNIRSFILIFFGFSVFAFGAFLIGRKTAKNNKLASESTNSWKPDISFVPDLSLTNHLVILPPLVNSPSTKKIQLKLLYNCELGGMNQYIVISDQGNYGGLVLIDKKNKNISSQQLTKTGNYYNVDFFDCEAGRLFWDEKPEIKYWYFDKDNNKFTLKVEEFVFSGICEDGCYIFGNARSLPIADIRKGFKCLHIDKNHPKIKKLLSKGKLQKAGEKFTVSFGQIDSKRNHSSRYVYVFLKNNSELEIQEV